MLVSVLNRYYIPLYCHQRVIDARERVITFTRDVCIYIYIYISIYIYTLFFLFFLFSKRRSKDETIDALEISFGGTSCEFRACKRYGTDVIVVRGRNNNEEEASQRRFRWRKGKKLLFPLCSHDCLPAPVAKVSSCIRSTIDGRSSARNYSLLLDSSRHFHLLFPFFFYFFSFIFRRRSCGENTRDPFDT